MVDIYVPDTTPRPGMLAPTTSQIEEDSFLRTCYLKGCLDRGYFQPVLVFSPDGKIGVRFPLRDKLFCYYHRDMLDYPDLLGRPNGPYWQAIQSSFSAKGRQVPEYHFTRLEWRDN